MRLSDTQNYLRMHFSIHCTQTVLPFPAACSSSLHLHPTSIIIIIITIITTTPSQNRKPFNPRSPRFYRCVCTMFSILHASFVAPATNPPPFLSPLLAGNPDPSTLWTKYVCMHACTRAAILFIVLCTERSVGCSCIMNERYGVDDLGDLWIQVHCIASTDERTD